MGSSAVSALQLPVLLNGIRLGHPTDLLLDAETWHALGFVVRCGDESVRFLPFGASRVEAAEIAVASPLLLLEGIDFYQERGASLRALLDGEVAGEGSLRDLVVDRNGRIVELEVERDGIRRRIPADGVTVVPTRASAA
jgi:hypothetical protein